MSASSPRSGAALVAVLLALSLTSALVVGGAYVARELSRATSVAERGGQLEAYPEEAILRAIQGWDPAAAAAQPVGTTLSMVGLTVGRVHVRLESTRMSSRAFWLIAAAADAAKPLMRRRLGVLVLADSAGAGPLPQRAWTELP